MTEGAKLNKFPIQDKNAKKTDFSDEGEMEEKKGQEQSRSDI